MKVLSFLVCIFLLTASAVAQESPRIPDTPAPVIDLVYAQPFALGKGFKYTWSKERPIVSSRTLVVLKVDPDLVFPRNAAEPVLYAGDRTVQRLNNGYESGHVIGIIPGEVDLASTPFWFGRPNLPERVTASMIKSERESPDVAKIEAFAAEKVRDVTRERLQVPDLFSLLRDHVADLVLEYSPQEEHLAKKWRLPVAQAPTKPR